MKVTIVELIKSAIVRGVHRGLALVSDPARIEDELIAALEASFATVVSDLEAAGEI